MIPTVMAVLAITTAVMALIFTLRYLVHSRLVERSWNHPVPPYGEKGHEEARALRGRLERARMRTGMAVIACYAAGLLLSVAMQSAWAGKFEALSLGTFVFVSAATMVVVLRSMMHSQRSLKHDFERMLRRRRWHDRGERGDGQS